MSSADMSANEAAVRQVMDEWAGALRARDLDAMMRCYSPDVVFFDAIAPLQIATEAYRKNWEGFFTWFPGPVNFELRNPRVSASDNAAFTCGLVRLLGTTAEGKEEGAWMRVTFGFERKDGTWRIAHEHWSMPMDMESGKAVTDLQPE